MMHLLTIAAMQELGHNSFGPVPPKPLVQAEEYSVENAVEQKGITCYLPKRR